MSTTSKTPAMLNMLQVYGCIRDHLRSNPMHVARVILGHASEQWFSSEAFVAINWPSCPLLPVDHSALTEYRKRDMTIYDEAASKSVAAVEAKVIFNNKNLWSQLPQLKAQIEQPKPGEGDDCYRCGILYAIWGSHWTRREVRDERPTTAPSSRSLIGIFL